MKCMLESYLHLLRHRAAKKGFIQPHARNFLGRCQRLFFPAALLQKSRWTPGRAPGMAVKVAIRLCYISPAVNPPPGKST